MKTKGAQIRSKAKWVNEGEKNTKFFLGLEKSHQTFNVIKELKTSDGKIAKSENEILGENVAITMKICISRKTSMTMRLIIISINATFQN